MYIKKKPKHTNTKTFKFNLIEFPYKFSLDRVQKKLARNKKN